jgi:hypothetical protein
MLSSIRSQSTQTQQQPPPPPPPPPVPHYVACQGCSPAAAREHNLHAGRQSEAQWARRTRGAPRRLHFSSREQRAQRQGVVAFLFTSNLTRCASLRRRWTARTPMVEPFSAACLTRTLGSFLSAARVVATYARHDPVLSVAVHVLARVSVPPASAPQRSDALWPRPRAVSCIPFFSVMLSS